MLEEALRLYGHDNPNRVRFFTKDQFDVGGSRSNGTRRLRLYRHILSRIQKESMKSKFWEMQREIIELYTQAAGPVIVGFDNYKQNMSYFNELLHCENASNKTYICATRQFGKTVVTAAFSLAGGAVLYKGNFQIAGAVEATSVRILASIVEHAEILKIPILKKSAYKLSIFYDGSRTDFFALNSSTNSSVGIAPNIMVADEAAKIPINMFEQGILPLFGNEGRCLICITTPHNSADSYSEMIKTDKSWNVKQYCLACQKCIDEGKTLQCYHNAWMNSPYYSMRQKEYLKKSMSEPMYAQEIMGVINEVASYCFDRKKLREFLFDESTFTPLMIKYETKTHVFIAIDPARGGSSEMAIVSFVRSNHQVQIIGIDSDVILQAKPECQQVLIRNHCRALVEFFCMNPKHYDFFIIPEQDGCNTDIIVTEFKEALKEYQVYVITVDHVKSYFSGNRVDYRTKYSARTGVTMNMEQCSKKAVIWTAYLFIHYRNLTICKDMIVGKEETDLDGNPKQMDIKASEKRKKLFGQLCNYRHFYEVSGTSSVQKEVYTGKTSKDEDDIATCVAFGLYFSNILWEIILQTHGSMDR
jgi:hypothetical protein